MPASKRKPKKRITFHVREDALENFTLGDLLTLEKFGKEGKGDITVAEVVLLLEKILREDPRLIPLSQMGEVSAMVADAVASMLTEEEAKN